jgi:hypothetical protein
MTIFLGALESEAKDFKFPEFPGWNQSEEVQTFVPKTLFEYINGAADLYLAYDFEELKSAEYHNDKKASVTVDVYRHKTPIDAFGIYSQERLPDANYLDVGVQGYYEKNVLNVLSGDFYVKINSFSTVSMITGRGGWSGLENFAAVVEDPLFWHSFRNTAVYAVVGTLVASSSDLPLPFFSA